MFDPWYSDEIVRSCDKLLVQIGWNTCISWNIYA